MAASKFGVPPVAIAGAIYIEQYHNVNMMDYITDVPGAYVGLNTSIGLGQVRVQTADLVEKAGLMPDVGKLATIAMLKEDCTNILYVAAYLALLKKQWQASGGEELGDDIDIWLTLYNSGFRKPGYGINEFGEWFNDEEKYINNLLEKGKKKYDSELYEIKQR